MLQLVPHGTNLDILLAEEFNAAILTGPFRDRREPSGGGKKETSGGQGKAKGPANRLGLINAMIRIEFLVPVILPVQPYTRPLSGMAAVNELLSSVRFG